MLTKLHFRYFESEETPGLIMVIIKKNSLLSV